LATILGFLHETALAGAPDAELLRRFTGGSGAEAEAAFTVLVRRHGPAVFRACRATLRDRHDAEDAFQATFLVLATKARGLAPQTALGPWLWEVARRVSVHARAASARRRAHELRAARTTARSVPPAEPDVAGLVLEAVGRLPEKYRTPILLCDLEGLSYQEAAERLGLSHGAVRNRLARGRERLRAVLGRLGLASVSAVAAQGAAPLVPRALAVATARAAVLVAAGSADGLVPESVLVLVNGGLVVSKLKSLCLSALAAGVLVAGAVGLSGQPPSVTPVPATEAPAPQQPGTTLTPDPVAAEPPAVGTQAAPAPAGDPAVHIAALAREVSERRRAGDVRGARQALRRLHRAALDWDDALAEERPAARPIGTTDDSTNWANKTPGRAPPRAGAGRDMEQRLADVERKLDLLLRRLDAAPEKPGGRTPPPVPQPNRD
jgi:RNA polymerase sigma factor (sigma-70 family)